MANGKLTEDEIRGYWDDGVLTLDEKQRQMGQKTYGSPAGNMTSHQIDRDVAAKEIVRFAQLLKNTIHSEGAADDLADCTADGLLMASAVTFSLRDWGVHWAVRDGELVLTEARSRFLQPAIGDSYLLFPRRFRQQQSH